MLLLVKKKKKKKKKPYPFSYALPLYPIGYLSKFLKPSKYREEFIMRIIISLLKLYSNHRGSSMK